MLRKGEHAEFAKTKTDEDSGDSDHDGGSMASGVGSMGSTDHVNYHDFTSPVPERVTPTYVGQSSEVAWMRRLDTELRKGPGRGAAGKEHSSVPEGSRPLANRQHHETWPEDMDSSVVGDQLDPYDLPIKSTVDELLKAFFTTVHPAFPILDKARFLRQYEQLSALTESDPKQNGIFVALLQTVLAIGAVHAHMSSSDWAGDERDHLLFFARGRVLGSYSGLLSESVNVGQVQILGLATIYLIATNQLNR